MDGRSSIDRLLRFLERCVATAFFGNVTIGFQNGRVSSVEIKQTKKLDEL